MARRPRTQTKSIDAGPDPWRTFRAKLAATRLTDRQRRFVVAYIKRPVGARAARAARYSRNRARQQSYDNLRKPRIRALIDEARGIEFQDWCARMGIDPSRGFLTDCVTEEEIQVKV